MAGTEILAGVEGFFTGRDIRNRWEDRKQNRRILENQETRTQQGHDLNMTVTGDGNTRANEAHGLNMTVTRDSNGRANESHGLNMRVGTSAQDQRDIDNTRTNRENERVDGVAQEERDLLAEVYPDPATGTAPAPVAPVTAAPVMAPVPVLAPTAPTTTAPAAPAAPRSLTQAMPPIAPAQAPAAPRTAPTAPAAPLNARGDMARSIGAPPAMVQAAETADINEHALLTGTGPDGAPLTDVDREQIAMQVEEVDAALSDAIPAYNPEPRPRTATPQAPTAPAMPSPVDILPAGTDTRSIPQQPQPTVAPVPVAQGSPTIETIAPRGRSLTAVDMQIEEARRASMPAGADLRSIPPTPASAQTVTPAQAPVMRDAPGTDGAAQAPATLPDPTPNTPPSPLIAPPPADATPAIDTLPTTQPDAKPNAPGTVAPMSPEQRTAAAADLEVFVKGEASDRLKAFYRRNGQPEKAEALDAFYEQEQTKQAMGAWTDAVLAAQLGDDAAFETAIAQVYNRNYADGYEIINDGKAFVRDEAGNIVGAEVEFRNQQTGEVFTRTFEGSTDLYAEAINALAPSAIFEHQWSLYEAGKARETAMAQAAQDLEIAKGQPDPKAFTDRVLSLAGELADLDTVPQGAEIYIEQAMALIAQEQARGAPGASVPRYTGQ